MHAEMVRNLVEIAAEYEAMGRNGQFSDEHVERWLAQFSEDVREPLLEAVFTTLSRTYLPRATAEEFIRNCVTNQQLAGDDQAAFWRTVAVLDIQRGGRSQSELRQLLDAGVQDTFGYGLGRPCADSSRFIYLDDVLFSGNRVLQDLGAWIRDEAPSTAAVEIVMLAFHTSGQYYANQRLKKAAQDAGKQIAFRWWRIIEIENRLDRAATSANFRPRVLPDDQSVRDYCAALAEAGYPPRLRGCATAQGNFAFGSEDQRQLMETQLLLAGLQIRSFSEHPDDSMRPLGYSRLQGLGFGATVVTYRNCPNTCPLALWWGNPAAGSGHPLTKWYPLFPRRTYEDLNQPRGW